LALRILAAARSFATFSPHAVEPLTVSPTVTATTLLLSKTVLVPPAFPVYAVPSNAVIMTSSIALNMAAAAFCTYALVGSESI
jgi:hypothetical protein